MNTATTTMTLNEGYFSRRNWFDWVFAALVIAGGLFALQRYGHAMDVYEKGILIGAIPSVIWLGWFWRPLATLMIVVGVVSLSAIGLYQNDGAGDLARFIRPPVHRHDHRAGAPRRAILRAQQRAEHLHRAIRIARNAQ